MAQTVKNLPAMWETWVRPLGWEDCLEEGMAIQSSILAWRIPMDRGAYRATVHGVSRLTVIVTYLHALESEAWLTLASCVTLGDLLTSLNLSLLNSCFYPSYDSVRR